MNLVFCVPATRIMREHQAAQQSSGESFGDKHGLLLSLHPSLKRRLKRRLKRITKQGACLDAPVTPGVEASGQ